MNFRKWRMVILVVVASMSISLLGCGKKETSNKAEISEAKAGTTETRKDSVAEAPKASTEAKSEAEVAITATSEDAKADTTTKDKATIETSFSEKQQISAGQLTSGEWNDLENWDWWVRLLNNQEWDQYQNRWSFYTSKKIQIIVHDNQKPVIDVKVVLYDKQGSPLWTTKTDTKGTANLFAELFNPTQNTLFDLVIEDGQNKKKLEDIKLPKSEPIYIEFNQNSEASNILDLMFMVDTTGSMQDELDYLEAELKNVIRRVDNEASGNLDINLSCNYYRDHGDEYVVRSFPFTKNTDEVIEKMTKQYADGGGDFEEAVEEALEDAVENHQWSSNARTRLLFLVLDAPPHYSDNTVNTLHNVIKKAAAKGIRVIPVASSGIDKDTESLLRFFSISTGGTYVFLTDHSGIGNSHIEPTIGDYKVEALNDLLVRVINEYTKK